MKLLTEIVAGLGILAYLAGWLYLYYFLRYFGFDIFEVEIPFHYFFVYAFPAVVAPVLGIGTVVLILLILLALVAARCKYWEQLSDSAKQVEWWVGRRFRGSSFDMVAIKIISVLSVALSLLAIIVLVASKSATTEAIRVISGPSVYVSLSSSYHEEIEKEFKGKAKFKVNKYLIQGSKADLIKYPVKIVLADKSRYFLFLVKDKKNNAGVALSLPKSAVIAMGRQND